MPNQIQLTIDGQAVAAAPDETIMSAADQAGITIPRLCAYKGLSSIGACRLCVVEIAGIPRLLPACATKVAEGMEVTTRSARLVRYRRMMLELLLAERNHICAACVSNGHCELQNLMVDHGLTHTRFPYRYPAYDMDLSHERFGYDPNRCVLCTRCVRVCHEVEGARTWGIVGRGVRAVVGTDLHRPWGESQTCTSCGKCVEVCPTGALFEKGKAVGEQVKKTDVIARLMAGRAST